MIKNKYLLYFFIFIICLTFISSNGLMIINQTFPNVTKTIDNNVNINFILTNSEPFTFYNITFETNDVANMTKIPQLISGNSTNVTATIKTNTNFNGTLNVIGFYEAKLGTSNTTKEVQVKYDTGITPCVFSIIKGDSVNWNNSANRNIVMKNSETNADITPLAAGTNYTQKFNEPLILNYYFSWLGFKFTQICTLTVLNDVGYITNPEHNANLNLSINVNYEPTTIQATFLETNYSVGVYTSEEGLFLVKNTGNKIAKKIHITNSWFAFTPNDFDLDAGASRTVAYVINPIIQNTNQTDKNYDQIITLTGNFENINQHINVFIPYADIDSGNYTNSDSIISLIAKYCLENPNVAFCKSNPTVIYKNGSEGDNMTQEQFRAILEYQYTIFQGMMEFNTWAKETIYNMSGNLTQIAIDNNITRTEVQNIKTENQGTTSMIYFIVLGICIFVIIAGGIWLLWYFRREKKNRELRRW